MILKSIGAVLIVVSCGGFGFSVAAAYKREDRMYQELIKVLQYMLCELPYHLTPLPELCHNSGKRASGKIGSIFSSLSQELSSQLLPDVCSCMRTVINREESLPVSIRAILLDLGNTLGNFDLDGQLSGLHDILKRCEMEIYELNLQHSERLRGYRTLGLCAGAALVIIFL